MNNRVSNFCLSVLCVSVVTGCSEDQPTMVCLPEGEADQTVNISGGNFTFGDNRYYPDEGPAKEVKLLGPETAGIPPPRSISKNTLSPHKIFVSLADKVMLGEYAGTTSTFRVSTFTQPRALVMVNSKSKLPGTVELNTGLGMVAEFKFPAGVH